MNPSDSRRAGDVAPDFIIVGTPRSGTTFVQRLASEIDGVVVPPETHFFSDFYRGLIKRRSFPLKEPQLHDELSVFLAMETSQGLALDIEDVLRICGGVCRSPGELFGAITRSLAGPAVLVGEKTPDHLRWWRPLSQAFPHMRVIGVVRDPRGVVASRIVAGWGARIPELLAGRWRLDQQELFRAESTLGPKRYLQVRYEDAVSDSLATRSRLAHWLGVADQGSEIDQSSHRLFLPWEHWKRLAAEPVNRDRIRGWIDVLDQESVAGVLSICRVEMQRLGYWDEEAERGLGAYDKSRLTTTVRVTTLRMILSRLRERIWVRHQKLSR